MWRSLLWIPWSIVTTYLCVVKFTWELETIKIHQRCPLGLQLLRTAAALVALALWRSPRAPRWMRLFVRAPRSGKRMWRSDGNQPYIRWICWSAYRKIRWNLVHGSWFHGISSFENPTIRHLVVVIVRSSMTRREWIICDSLPCLTWWHCAEVLPMRLMVEPWIAKGPGGPESSESARDMPCQAMPLDADHWEHLCAKAMRETRHGGKHGSTDLTSVMESLLTHVERCDWTIFVSLTGLGT